MSIIFQKLTGGIGVNHLFCCHLKSDLKRDDALVMRTFGDTLVDMCREYEVMGMQIGAQLGISQPVYGIFSNGVVYKYAHGRTLVSDDINNINILRLICMVY